MPGQSSDNVWYQTGLAKLEVLSMLNFTFPSLFFFCPVSSGGSSTSQHQDLHIITQNILCLFPFKPVKDQVLPSGSLFLFNLDVPDTYWWNTLLQRL